MRIRKISLLAGGAAVLVAVLSWVAVAPGPRTGGVAVMGDGAPALRAALGVEQASPETATFVLVSVETWDKLRYIADMQALCGAACDGPAGLVRAVRLSPRGSQKVLFLNLSAWSGASDCIARTVAAERATLGAAAPPDCAADVPLAGGTRWVLPAGLGAI